MALFPPGLVSSQTSKHLNSRKLNLRKFMLI
jgi:hypothetical protein